MNKLIVGMLGAALLVSGCSRESEAEKLGYRGHDISEAQFFFTIDGVTTNWAPVRLFEVNEEYAISTNETALLEALAVGLPGLTVEKIPEGYTLDEEGAWTAAWKKNAEHLGVKGTKGFYSHFNEDTKKYETGEIYFSSYWKTREEALAALTALKTKIAAEFGPLKVHDFADSWIAEYLRLRVLCVVGPKADGSWSCMLTLADKANMNTLTWEPAKIQEARKSEYLFAKAMRAWRAAVKEVCQKNRAACAAALSARGLKGLEDVMWDERDDGSRIFYKVENWDETNTVEQIWAEQRGLLKAAYGLELPEKPNVMDGGYGYRIYSGFATNDTPYEAAVDIALPSAMTNVEEAVEIVMPPRQWRLVVHEKMLPGNVLPARPVRKGK